MLFLVLCHWPEVVFNYGVSVHGVFIYITTIIDKTEPPQILYVSGINSVVNEPPALPGDNWGPTHVSSTVMQAHRKCKHKEAKISPGRCGGNSSLQSVSRKRLAPLSFQLRGTVWRYSEPPVRPPNYRTPFKLRGKITWLWVTTMAHTSHQQPRGAHTIWQVVLQLNY